MDKIIFSYKTSIILLQSQQEEDRWVGCQRCLHKQSVITLQTLQQPRHLSCFRSRGDLLNPIQSINETILDVKWLSMHTKVSFLKEEQVLDMARSMISRRILPRVLLPPSIDTLPSSRTIRIKGSHSDWKEKFLLTGLTSTLSVWGSQVQDTYIIFYSVWEPSQD